ncbi:MAG: hypothetical protein LLF76_07045 [Planctomycetaceae bacterium]|nr:hypothetical protein [Planctomycetaceae bacterium]
MKPPLVRAWSVSVAVYGGFDPGVGDDTFGERDWNANVTILSGLQAGADSYHVFYHPYSLNLGVRAVLDGFTVAGGDATGAATHEGAGGAIFSANASNPSIINCTIVENASDGNAGGIGGFDATVYVVSCVLWGNTPSQVVTGMLCDPFTVAYSDVQGGFTGTANIDADPRCLSTHPPITIACRRARRVLTMARTRRCPPG